MSIAAEVVSNSIKNGILFVLIILIVHFAVKSTVENKGIGSPDGYRKTSSAPREAFNSAPAPTSDADLLNYVFGGVAESTERGVLAEEVKTPTQNNTNITKSTKSVDDVTSGMTGMTGMTGMSVPKQSFESPLPPPLPVDSGLGSEGLSENGFFVVNKFQNESVMCGGSLYPDAPDLQGFDGGSVQFSW